jgi:peptide/nickel transport system substrate-binding protein
VSKNDKIVDTIRRRRSEIENALIDELAAGHIGRREFLRHGTVLGMSLPLLGSLTAALGFGGVSLSPTRAAAAAGGTVRVAMTVPTGAIDPVTVADNGGLVMLGQTGEYLALSGPDLKLQPVLAESWKPNKDGSVWTFALRKGVKFHNGQAMTADDVVASIDRLADPQNASNALSALAGALSKGGTKKVDDHTVEFHLDAPNGNFPYLLSSDNYNAIILPANYAGDFEQNFVGTGPFKLEKYTAKVGASFVRNDDYWGSKAMPDRSEFTFYTDLQPQILALQGRQVDVISQVPVRGAEAILNDPNIEIHSLKSSAHTQVHMRTDMDPFKDKRVRRALALCLKRETLIKGLFRGRASLGNDSPFAPVFPSTDTSVAQRDQDIKEAKQLLEAAGVGKGFKVTLTTERYLEIPDYAVLIQNAAKEVGITIDLKIEDQGAYYGKAVFGESDWLDSVLGITDYGHRGVPNVLLSAPLKSEGTWNSAHFKNKEYDALVAQYVAALDLASQRAVAGKIQRLLLEETPIIFGYFYDFLTPTVKNLGGTQSTAMGHIFLQKAAFA